jgi:hypothetical protein
MASKKRTISRTLHVRLTEHEIHLLEEIAADMAKTHPRLGTLSWAIRRAIEAAHANLLAGAPE